MKKNASPLHDYARFSSIALQMAVVILIGVFGGLGLDWWIEPGFPLFTIILSLASVILAIYMIIRNFAKPK